jgi:hypothetical protein
METTDFKPFTRSVERAVWGGTTEGDVAYAKARLALLEAKALLAILKMEREDALWA